MIIYHCQSTEGMGNSFDESVHHNNCSRLISLLLNNGKTDAIARFGEQHLYTHSSAHRNHVLKTRHNFRHDIPQSMVKSWVLSLFSD